MKLVPATAALSCLLVSAAAADDMPDIAEAMLSAAVNTGDTAQIEAVANAASQVFPDYADAIAAYAAENIAALTPPEPPAELTSSPEDTGAAGWLAMKPWDGKISAAAVTSSGNSENTAVGIAIEAARTAGAFTHNFGGYFDIGAAAPSRGADRELNQKRWGASYQLDYAVSEKTYAYGRLSYDEDEFSGFEYRLFGGAGLGHFLYKSEPFTWKVEGGPGYRYSLVENSPAVQEEIAIYGATELDWVIRKGWIFEQDFNATWTNPTTTFVSVTSLTTALTDSLAVGLAYDVRFETNPPPGFVKTDRVIRANLTYGF